ncbi:MULTISPECIES: hypothetical protein [unclassified Wolbachia]|uniref:hypothetical protein n=1 Tax=unclassified Wolbachia TaxID=2640676 RepID=UPI0021F83076|nr:MULTISPECIES: hypothetical protein [unclassified Wolbachia]
MALKSKLLDGKVVESARGMLKKVRNNAYAAKKLNNHYLQGEGLNINQFEIDHCHEVARLPG